MSTAKKDGSLLRLFPSIVEISQLALSENIVAQAYARGRPSIWGHTWPYHVGFHIKLSVAAPRNLIALLHLICRTWITRARQSGADSCRDLRISICVLSEANAEYSDYSIRSGRL